MVFTIVTIIFLPISFIAAFFAINFQDWGDRLTIGYVSKYMFPIGLAISFVFVASAFLVHDISKIWKAIVRSTEKYINFLFHKPKSNMQGVNNPGNISNFPSRGDDKPGTAGGASTTAYRSIADDVDWKRRGLEGPDAYMRMSRDRDQYEHARLGLSPIRYGARKLSIGSGHGGVPSWTRPSFDGRRDRFSGDLERGRDPSRSRINWESAR